MAPGHYTLVMYTNPDLEDDSRKVTVALDSYRSRFLILNLCGWSICAAGFPRRCGRWCAGKSARSRCNEGLRLKKAGVAGGDKAPNHSGF